MCPSGAVTAVLRHSLVVREYNELMLSTSSNPTTTGLVGTHAGVWRPPEITLQRYAEH